MPKTNQRSQIGEVLNDKALFLLKPIKNNPEMAVANPDSNHKAGLQELPAKFRPKVSKHVSPKIEKISKNDQKACFIWQSYKKRYKSKQVPFDVDFDKLFRARYLNKQIPKFKFAAIKKSFVAEFEFRNYQKCHK